MRATLHITLEGGHQQPQGDGLAFFLGCAGLTYPPIPVPEPYQASGHGIERFVAEFIEEEHPEHPFDDDRATEVTGFGPTVFGDVRRVL